ncbi:MAG: spermidine/putrescine ABC transporter substrate-binding protein [Anaerolineae bacterium]|nr:spermidine/putrescine ABC transporter substrate-binding protein [Anaerolineae bacterium]MCB0249148.1 spermidine/putrescine ABC transporter substrate-binding protein [Anaerolineae bacterium]MCB9130403.1 spermidine/putrescine ABC transporter substrate-binding protein [Anaerolineales bacterium]
MRRFYYVFLLLLVIALAAAGCSQPAAAPATSAPASDTQTAPAASSDSVKLPEEIVMFNWTDYIDPDLYGEFEEASGVRVIEDNYSSNEELLAKLQGGSAGYAVIVPSDYTVGIMIEEGLLAKLDHANIPNLSNLADRFTQVPYDPGSVYCVPYMWGTTGFGYDSTKVDPPASWSVFFEPDPNSDIYGRVTMLDDPRESFAAALAYLGYDINTTDEAQLNEAKDALIRAKAQLAGYDSDTYEDLVASGENLLAHGWNGDFLLAMEDNENIVYVTPKEGGVVFVDNLCIPASATPEQKLAGEMLINFLLEPEVAARNSEFIYYASPNKAAEAFLPEDFLNDTSIYPPAEVLDKLQYLEPVGEAESIYQRLWDEVKSAQ